MQVSPREPWSYEDLGTVYLDQGKPDSALEMFRKALTITSELPASLDGIGKAYLHKGQPAEAIPYFQKALRFHPDNSKLHFQLGQAYLKAGQQEKGKQEIAEAGRLKAQAREKQADRLYGARPVPVGPVESQ